MRAETAEFIALAMKWKVLQFGDFTLKSGKKSAYFFNFGAFHEGSNFLELGRIYALGIRHHFAEGSWDVLHGPAYKGIPLVVATAMQWTETSASRESIPISYDRKEAKQTGEGGQLVGAPLAGKRVLILDDVLTAGTAVKAAVELIRNAGGEIAGVLEGLDRSKDGEARKRLTEELGAPVKAIADRATLIQHFAEHKDPQWRETATRIAAED